MDASARGRTFFDSNFLVYLYDDRDQRKKLRAQAIWDETPAEFIVLSTQVLGEFYWTVTRKLPTALLAPEAQLVVERFSVLSVVSLDKDMVGSAIELAQAASIAYWDALIVVAARRAGCARILTEDLNHGQVIDGVRVENPFLTV